MGTRSKLSWAIWGLGWALKLSFAALAVLLPVAGVWIASSLAAHLDGPLWASLVAGALCFPLLPLSWDLFRTWQRKRRGDVRPRVLTLFDRLVLRTLVVNAVFVGSLLAMFPSRVYEALSTRGDWMLGGSTAPWAESMRGSLFGTAERLRWLHEATHQNEYEDLIDPSLTRPRDGSPPPTPVPTRERPTIEPSAPAVSPSDLYHADRWPVVPTLHPAVVNLPPEVETSLESVARHLIAQESDPVQRVKVLHDYVADRVAYDVAALEAGQYPPQDAATVFQTRMAVCAGYANLLAAMAETVGIEMVVVGGDARDEDGLFDGRGHAWNAVAIGKQWYLLDATWDAGHVGSEGFVKDYDTDYFLTPPEVFVISHLPDDPKWELLETPLSPGDVLRLPNLRPSFAALDLELLPPVRARHSVAPGESLTLHFANPHQFALDGSVRAPGQSENGRRCDTNDTRTAVTCTFPDAGRRHVSLFGPEGVFMGRIYVDVG